MKKIISLFLVFCFLLSYAPIVVNAALGDVYELQADGSYKKITTQMKIAQGKANKTPVELAKLSDSGKLFFQLFADSKLYNSRDIDAAYRINKKYYMNDIKADANKGIAVKESGTPNVVVKDEGETPAPTEDLKVISITAVNGKLTVKLNGELINSPLPSDFKIVQNVNGATRAIAATALKSSGDTVELTIPALSATEVDQEVFYSVGFKETPLKTSNKFTIDKVGELKALRAEVLSSTQVRVIFNQEVDKVSAETLTNYKLGKAKNDGTIDATGYKAFSDTNSFVYLEEGDKSVVITLGAAEDASSTSSIIATAGQFDNKTGYLLEVSKAILPVQGRAAERNAELPFTLDDSGKPQVEKMEIAEGGGLKIYFNEKLDDSTNVDVTIKGYNGSYTPEYDNGKSIVTVPYTDLYDSTTPKYGLEAGETYNCAVSKAKDVYAQEMNVYEQEITMEVQAEAPTVEKVEQISETKIRVTFSEPVVGVASGAALVGDDFDLTKGAKHFRTPTVKKAGSIYELEFATADQADDVIYDRSKGETAVDIDVHIVAVKDGAGNVTSASKHTVKLQKDTEKPMVISKDNQNNGALTLTFNKSIDTIKTTTAVVAGKAYVLSSNGKRYNLQVANVTSVLNNASDKGEIVFSLATIDTDRLNGNYTLVVEADAITDKTLNGGNKNNEIRESFIVAGDGLINKPTVSAWDGNTTPGSIVVTFNEQINYESAAKSDNFKVDGRTIPAASTFLLDPTGKILTITVPEATFTTTGSYPVEVSGVRNLAGTIMDPYTFVEDVVENERIALQSAKVLHGKLILTFNEDVRASTIGTTLEGTDLEVKIEGVPVSITTVNDATADTSIENNQLSVEAPTGISFNTGMIEVKILYRCTVTDAAGNECVKEVTVIASR